MKEVDKEIIRQKNSEKMTNIVPKTISKYFTANVSSKLSTNEINLFEHIKLFRD